ncbi:GntR family transcriptional regulator [Capsulimonas corticalis]|uniref:GntR family transcriptional regulator n=1 Tax=Capsulimonas corticalis TaxID=2219043 RepID=A0A402D2D1_9BACT|nr:PLP-dependent aminotransferase family protein [Capsulimonas corticalis]BDI30007.1 GntR family transcriptional regulator [Capsulimonas corticalis]
MPKRAAGAILTGLNLDRTLAAPLHRQIYDGVRSAILDRRLTPGERLPSTRTLAGDLGVSRRTVVDAFSQLYAEGYIDERVGAGAYVARALPEDFLNLVVPAKPLPEAIADTPQFSQRFLEQKKHTSQAIAQFLRGQKLGRAFLLGTPALDEFPNALWGRLGARVGRRTTRHASSYQPTAGCLPLRESVAAYLGSARGVRCSPEQILIVAGSQQAIAIAAHVLIDPGDAVWMEEPGYFGAKGALLGTGARLIPVPVDSEGLNVAAGRERAPDARMAFVTPSHQMPLGVTMSLARRLALLEWAREAHSWIIEDDYDSEYRYVSRPLAALQSLDTHGRVIYTGTFSKVLFPALRLGYIVAPPALVDAFAVARRLMDSHSPLREQLILTEFMQEGHFERHIRRMRSLYQERQQLLVEETRRELGGTLDTAPADGGMHLVGYLPTSIDDGKVALAAEKQGIRTQALSHNYLETPQRSGLVLGYAAASSQEIIDGVRGLATILRAG